VCTNILHNTTLDGSGKGREGWFPLDRASITYDHPSHADLEHALNIDFAADGHPGMRVAVELSLASARRLAAAIATACDEAEAYERGEPLPGGG